MWLIQNPFFSLRFNSKNQKQIGLLVGDTRAIWIYGLHDSNRFFQKFSATDTWLRRGKIEKSILNSKLSKKIFFFLIFEIVFEIMKREVQRIRITNTNKENFIRRITNNEYDDFLIRYLKFYSKILFGRTLTTCRVSVSGSKF
jgi:hypothetical protein